MSSDSSSSDSDSEPIRKIRISIRPKEEAIKPSDTDVIKASIQSWRPLRPFADSSRASSPLTLFGQQQSLCSSQASINDTTLVPIAIAIQESIELVVRGGKQTKQVKPIETRFETRALGNIKVAFPNSFARLGATISNSPVLKLKIHSADNITRYYPSPLIKDLESETSSLAESSTLSGSVATFASQSSSGTNLASNNINSKPINNNNNVNSDNNNRFSTHDLFDLTESPMKPSTSGTKIIEFDMHALMNQLSQLYQKAPQSRYYNVDVLRYQISPRDKFEQCPLQVCAYWKLEPRLIKLRIDFKHSNQASGFDLDRFKDVSFNVDVSNLVPDTFGNSLTTLTNANSPQSGLILTPQPLSTEPSFATPDTTNNHKNFITYEPSQACWNNEKKQLTWKFDNLMTYSRNDGFGSLLAKLDFRQQQSFFDVITNEVSSEPEPKPIEVKFSVVDSTISKIHITIESKGYRLPMVKKEIRSGRYRSEAHVF